MRTHVSQAVSLDLLLLLLPLQLLCKHHSQRQVCRTTDCSDGT